MMNSIFLVMAIIIYRILTLVLKRCWPINQVFEFIVMFTNVIAGVSPVVLIRWGVLEQSFLNVMLAIVVFVYFSWSSFGRSNDRIY